MRKDSLTLLGCTGSIAFVLIMGGSAKALMPPNFGGDINPRTRIQTNPMSTYQEDAPVAKQATEAKLKQLAQAQFGCICANCIGRVRQMIQEGTLSI